MTSSSRIKLYKIVRSPRHGTAQSFVNEHLNIHNLSLLSFLARAPFSSSSWHSKWVQERKNNSCQRGGIYARSLQRCQFIAESISSINITARCEQHISDFFFLPQPESEQLGPAHVIRTMFRVNCACATTQHCYGRDETSSPPAFSCTTSSKVLRRLLLIICESLLDPAVCKRMGLPRANKNSFCSLSVSHGFYFSQLSRTLCLPPFA